jgi:hypothetical protein
LQWLQDSSQINGDNFINKRREASNNFRNKRRECLKDKINELTTHNTKKNTRDMYRGINEFNKGYQPGTHLVKDENGECLHKILGYF